MRPSSTFWDHPFRNEKPIKIFLKIATQQGQKMSWCDSLHKTSETVNEIWKNLRFFESTRKGEENKTKQEISTQTMSKWEMIEIDMSRMHFLQI